VEIVVEVFVQSGRFFSKRTKKQQQLNILFGATCCGNATGDMGRKPARPFGPWRHASKQQDVTNYYCVAAPFH